MSSLCTARNMINSHRRIEINTYSQIQKTQDLVEGLLVRHLGRAEKATGEAFT
jgi:hypothetical protein